MITVDIPYDEIDKGSSGIVSDVYWSREKCAEKICASLNERQPLHFDIRCAAYNYVKQLNMSDHKRKKQVTWSCVEIGKNDSILGDRRRDMTKAFEMMGSSIIVEKKEMELDGPIYLFYAVEKE